MYILHGDIDHVDCLRRRVVDNRRIGVRLFGVSTLPVYKKAYAAPSTIIGTLGEERGAEVNLPGQHSSSASAVLRINLRIF